jgi:hypothetical protein
MGVKLMMNFRKVLMVVLAITFTLAFSFTSFAEETQAGKDVKPQEQNKQQVTEKVTAADESYNVFAYGKDSKEAVTEVFPTVKECFAWVKGKGLNGIIYSKTDAKKPVAIDLEGTEINLDSNYIFKYVSKKNLYDPKILAVQKTLNSLGYKLKADGLFGKHTYDEVKLFQKSAKLEVDGVIGEKTLERLATFNFESKIIAKK